MRRDTLLSALALLAVTAPFGDAPADEVAAAARPRSRQGLTFGADARTVRVPVTVLDRRGNPVLGLHGEDFEVEEDGHRRPVTLFSGERKPIRIALALDLSTSMSDKMDEVSDALSHFIGLLEPDDEIMVLTFHDAVSVECDFTSDRRRLDRVLDRLDPDGGTALFDAAAEAIRRVAVGPAESKAVVLVTDGMDTTSSTTFAELRDLARRSEVPVFSIGIGTEGRLRIIARPGGGIPGQPPVPRGWPGGIGGRGGPGGPGRGGWPGGIGGTGGGGRRTPPSPTVVRETDFDPEHLLELADDTGARAEILTGLRNDHGKVDRLRDAVESIAATLRHRYLVGYEPEPGKRGWRRIKVDVHRPSVKVRARKGYYSET